ncbi:MAG: acyl-CoA thioesterase [Gammaproteobacteria bacterium]|nr:acyl-CoA thioesterase [Gammaproteobacteria bacterium]
MSDYAFTIDMDVRDYECDIQGIVNNAVYQNYLEHARHEYLKQVGVDFAELARNGINLVVVRAELDYKLPLMSGDKFKVGLNMERESKIKFAFHQDIIRLADEKVMVKGKIVGTALNPNGRPKIPEELNSLLG